MRNNKSRRGRLRTILCAGLSLSALSVAAPALAADLNVFKSAPPPRGETQIFVEGGAFWTGGDRIPYFAGFGSLLGGLFGGVAPTDLGERRITPDQIGWDGAAGFDHRFAGSRWHVNGEVRYGQTKKSDSFASAAFLTVTDLSGGGFPGLLVNANANTVADLKERHWHADLGIGYDIITGPANLQVKFGMRVAEVWAKVDSVTNGTLSAAIVGLPPVLTASANANETDIRSFLGVGPRAGIDGSIPLLVG